ncbi:MAG: RtcB family protein [Solibacillus sp.]
MKKIQGKYDEAIVFTQNIDETTIEQIQTILDQPHFAGSHMRIMPDTHAGKGAVIGTTMKVTDKVVPNLVGVDIGCGILCVEVLPRNISVEKIDEIIHAHVPSGLGMRKDVHPLAKDVDLSNVIAPFEQEKALLSLGTLGGGNHFIEVNESAGRYFLTIHTGSRNLGVRVAKYHQQMAMKQADGMIDELKALITQMKRAGRHQEIEAAIKQFYATTTSSQTIPAELTYVEGAAMEHYLHDLAIAQQFATLNRQIIADVILKQAGLVEVGRIDTVHNYIDLDAMILRKGAISAKTGEQVIIPINMRDGSLIATGKGNADWNYSGPHGAGRILSRSKAKQLLNLDDFKETMAGIYTTTVNEHTIDESPFAYKTLQEIVDNTKDTIELQEIIKPIYNFKAAEYVAFKKKFKK